MTEEINSLTVDEILPYIGEYGRFQKILDLIFCLMNLPLAQHLIITTFWTITPSWHCTQNNSVCLFNGTFDADDQRRCNMSLEAWMYTETKQFSLVTQLDLHCDREWLIYPLSSSFYVGCGLGTLLGWFGDHFGRKSLLLPSFTIYLVLCLVSSFTLNVYAIMVIRFVMGLFYFGAYGPAYVLISEVVGSKQRAFALQLIFLSCPLANSMLALQAYFVRNWKILSIICSAPYLLLILTWKFVPESPEWLKSRGRTDEVMQILGQIGEWNKKILPNNIVLPRREETVAGTTIMVTNRVLDKCKLMKQCFGLAYIWMVVGLAFYGLYMAADELGGSIYRDFILLSLVDVPAAFTSVYVCNRFGRKLGTLIPLLVGGITCVITGFIPFRDNLNIIRVIFGMSGKGLICVAYDSLYTWSVEIFPTEFRSQCMGAMAIAASVGSSAAPWIAVGSRKFGVWCPFAIMGIPSIVGFVIGLQITEVKTRIELEHNDQD